MNSSSNTQQAADDQKKKRRRLHKLLVKNIIKTYRECEAKLFSSSDVVEDEMISFRRKVEETEVNWEQELLIQEPRSKK